MFCKVLLVMTIVGIAAAQYHQSNNAYGYGHHAVSSQNIVLHQSPTHVRHTPSYHHSHQPALISHNIGHQVDYHAPAHYAFEYSVHDPHTGDVKSQHETREGDAVHGFYSLHEADGTVRRVDYTADAHSGFNAVVHREGHATHVAPVHLRPIHHSHY